jgi:Nuclease-related domain
MSKSRRRTLNYGRSPNSTQSLDEQIDGLIHSFLKGPIVVSFFFLLFAALEWLRYYRPYRPEPIVYSVVAGIVLTAAAIRMLLLWPRMRALKLARDGEKAVQHFLEGLRQRGYCIFDHVVGKGFNLDHVLIGPAGIFTVETKIDGRVIRSNTPVIFDGDKIRLNGFEPERDTIVQAKRHANWLRVLLAESTGREFGVHPVILYPGCSVEWRGPKSRSIWVLSPEWLTSFLDHEPLRLSSDDIRLASFHVSQFTGAGS